MSFSVEIRGKFQTAGYGVFWKHFPAAGYLDTTFYSMPKLENFLNYKAKIIIEIAWHF